MLKGIEITGKYEADVLKIIKVYQQEQTGETLKMRIAKSTSNNYRCQHDTR